MKYKLEFVEFNENDEVNFPTHSIVLSTEPLYISPRQGEVYKYKKGLYVLVPQTG